MYKNVSLNSSQLIKFSINYFLKTVYCRMATDLRKVAILVVVSLLI